MCTLAARRTNQVEWWKNVTSETVILPSQCLFESNVHLFTQGRRPLFYLCTHYWQMRVCSDKYWMSHPSAITPVPRPLPAPGKQTRHSNKLQLVSPTRHKGCKFKHYQNFTAFITLSSVHFKIEIRTLRRQNFCIMTAYCLSSWWILSNERKEVLRKIFLHFLRDWKFYLWSGRSFTF